MQSLLLALLIFVLAAGFSDQTRAGCTDGGAPFPSAESDGIGGTGRAPDDPDEGGVGGTGLTGDDPDDGVGGTGIRAEGDAGIVGTVTGFGSICVGGVEIRYDADTPVLSDGQRVDASALAVGQVVEVVAQGEGDEMTARVIGIHYVARGPVASVDPTTNRITVLGQTVQLGPSTWTATDAEARQARAGDYQAGDFIEVGGLRRDDDVVMASFVARADAEGGVSLSGAVGEARGTLLSVAGTNVELAAGESAIAASGTSVTVSGTWDGNAIRAAHVAVRPSIPFDASVKRLDVEGYVRQAGDGGGVVVGEQRVALGGEAGDVKPGQRVRVEAVVSPDRRLIDGRIVPLRDLRPAGPAARPLPRELAPGALRRGAAQEGGGTSSGADPSEPPGARRDADRPGKGRSDAIDAPPPRDLPDRDRPERPDRPDRLDRPDRPDRPERPQRPDLPDRPERPQRPDLPDRPPRF